jgi:predicted nucleotidyltransferase
MLVHVLDAMLGTTTKVRILRALLRLTSPASGTEARGLAGVRSVKAMWTSLAELTELGILLRDQTPGTHLYRINREHHLAAPLAALFAAEASRVGEVRKALRSALEDAGLLDSVRSAVLYGSNARGEASPRSDLDVFVVTRDEAAVPLVRDVFLDAGSVIENRFGPFLSAYVLPEARVRERYQGGDPLLHTIEEEGQEVFGTPFDELVQSW